MVHHLLSGYSADGSTEAIGHNHEQSLRTAPDFGLCMLVNEQGTRNVEEVERHALNYHREHEHPHAGSRVAQTEKAKAQHPRQHGNHHDTLDAKTFQAEGDE